MVFCESLLGTFISEADSFRKIVAVPNGHTLNEPDGSILSFNADGKLIQIVDRNGNTQAITHTAGNVSTVTDNFGRSMEFQYNALNQLATLVTPAGSFTYTYDANNNLTQVENPESTFKVYIYDDPNDIHNLTGVIDEKGVRDLFVVYDTQDRATSSEGATLAPLLTWPDPRSAGWRKLTLLSCCCLG